MYPWNIYARPSTYNELVELPGPYFIIQSLGFDGAVVSVFDSKSKDSWFNAKSKSDELSHADYWWVLIRQNTVSKDMYILYITVV